MTMPEPTRSPRRKLIMQKVAGKVMTAAQIGALIGTTRDAAYNILCKMAEANQVSKLNRSNQVFWGPYVAPKKIVREAKFFNGTVTERLSIGYMATPARAGSMDAYAIPSRGIDA